MLKKGVKVNQATQPAARRAALSLRQGWKTSLRFSRGDTWMFIVMHILKYLPLKTKE